MMTEFLGEHVYSHAEKNQQLCEFIASINDILNDSAIHLHYPQVVANHRDCLARASSLRDAGFTQEDLSQLSLAFHCVLWTHKEWVPPLEQTADGGWREATWYPMFEKLYERAANAANRLRILGELKYSR